MERQETKRPRARLAAVMTAVAVLAGILLAASSPAAAASGCKQAGTWPPATPISWDIQTMDTDGLDNIGVWRTNLFRMSSCDQVEITWKGWSGTSYDTARVRTRSYYEDGSVRVETPWRTIERNSNYDTVILREGTVPGVRVRVDVHHVVRSYASSAYPPDPYTTVNY